MLTEVRSVLALQPTGTLKLTDCIDSQWDEFKTLDWAKIYDSMTKPAFVFDGRGILDVVALTKIGFKVERIGRGVSE